MRSESTVFFGQPRLTNAKVLGAMKAGVQREQSEAPRRRYLAQYTEAGKRGKGIPGAWGEVTHAPRRGSQFRHFRSSRHCRWTIHSQWNHFQKPAAHKG